MAENRMSEVPYPVTHKFFTGVCGIAKLLPAYLS